MGGVQELTYLGSQGTCPGLRGPGFPSNHWVGARGRCGWPWGKETEQAAGEGVGPQSRSRGPCFPLSLSRGGIEDRDPEGDPLAAMRAGPVLQEVVPFRYGFLEMPIVWPVVQPLLSQEFVPRPGLCPQQVSREVRVSESLTP